MPSAQGKYWIGTTRHEDFLLPSPLPRNVLWAKGQQEQGQGGFLHWQWVVLFTRSVRLGAVTNLFKGHWELTRSEAAVSYVWKEDTAIPGTQFEIGSLPLKRNSEKDWDKIWSAATKGDLDEIPADVRVRCYNQIKRIKGDHAQAKRIEKTVNVYWGPTLCGKSHKAFEEAGDDAYTKDPKTKWWCGYRGQKHVVIDEFRGSIDIAHMLRWLDKFPCCVETKGSTEPLCCTHVWITSNLDPHYWYPDLDADTRDALIRRLKITHFSEQYNRFH